MLQRLPIAFAQVKAGNTYIFCIQKVKETGDWRCIYQNYLDKACFQNVKAYGDFKDLTRRTSSDKIVRDNAFNIAKNSKCDEYQRGLASMLYKFLDKKLPVV